MLNVNQKDISIATWTQCSHIETSQMSCKINQFTGFYMTGTSVVNEVTYLTSCALLLLLNLKFRNSEKLMFNSLSHVLQFPELNSKILFYFHSNFKKQIRENLTSTDI